MMLKLFNIVNNVPDFIDVRWIDGLDEAASAAGNRDNYPLV